MDTIGSLPGPFLHDAPEWQSNVAELDDIIMISLSKLCTFPNARGQDYLYLLAAYLILDCPVPGSLLQEWLQALDGLRDGFFQRRPLDAGRLGSLGVVERQQLILRWQVTALDILRRQLVLQVRKVLAHNIQYFTVAKVPRRCEQPLATQLGLLKSPHMRLRDVSHIHPQEHARLGDLVFPLALHEPHDALIGCVDAIQAGQVVDHRTKDQGRVHGHDVELGVVGLVVDEFPSCFFGECLGCTVRDTGVLVDLVNGHRVPGFFSEVGIGVAGFRSVNDGGKGRSDDYTLYRGRRFGNGFEDSRSSNDGGVNQILLGIGYEMGLV